MTAIWLTHWLTD